MENDMERIIFYEAARQKAEADYLVNPQDADNLTRWGGALLELAHFHQGVKSLSMVEEAKAKLEQALKIDEKKPETLWWLGNACIAHGFLIPDSLKANELFETATSSFQKAVDLDPGNELYSKALEMAGKAPVIYVELQKQMVSQELASLGTTSGASGSGNHHSKGQNKRKKKKKHANEDFMYDMMGWAMLALGIAGWVAMAKIAPRPAIM